MQTIRYAKNRLARYETFRVYTFVLESVFLGPPVRRAGVMSTKRH